MLLIPEGQAGGAWEPSKKQCFFSEIREHRIEKYFHFFVFKGFKSD
jgi:hypothetical protein